MILLCVSGAENYTLGHLHIFTILCMKNVTQHTFYGVSKYPSAQGPASLAKKQIKKILNENKKISHGQMRFGF